MIGMSHLVTCDKILIKNFVTLDGINSHIDLCSLRSISQVLIKFGPLAHQVEHHTFNVVVPRSSRGRLSK